MILKMSCPRNWGPAEKILDFGGDRRLGRFPSKSRNLACTCQASKPNVWPNVSIRRSSTHLIPIVNKLHAQTLYTSHTIPSINRALFPKSSENELLGLGSKIAVESSAIVLRPVPDSCRNLRKDVDQKNLGQQNSKLEPERLPVESALSLLS